MKEKESRKFRVRLAGGVDGEAAATAAAAAAALSCVRYLRQYLVVHDVDDAVQGDAVPPPWAITEAVPCISIQQLARVLVQPNQQSAHFSNSHNSIGRGLICIIHSVFAAPAETDTATTEFSSFF